VFAFTASVVLAGSFALAQSDSQTPQNPPTPRSPALTQPAPSSSQDKSVPELRLTGCLIQGSSPTIFVLDNARQSTDAKTAEGKKYVVVMADAAGLRNQLNRQVTIVGTADAKSPMPPAATPDAGAKADERDLPRLSAKTIVRVADVCTTT
jgi:hypothetical protein